MSKDGRIWLSHTGLETLERCPRCFWLYYKKRISQPEGIVSRLANRFDVVLKNYFNIYRPHEELPELVKGRLEGNLQNPFVEKYFTRINQEYGFFGKLDECLVTEAGELIPVDFKTSSSDPREKETLAAYQSQIDAYLFLLKENRHKIADFGYLIYFFPDHSGDLHKGFPMVVHVTKLSGNPERAREKIRKAIEVLSGQRPKPSINCPFCSWYETIKKETGEKKQLKPSSKQGKLPLLERL